MFRPNKIVRAKTSVINTNCVFEKFPILNEYWNCN